MTKFENATFSHAVALRAALARQLEDAEQESVEADKAKDGRSAIAHLLRKRAVVLNEQIADLDGIIESMKKDLGSL